MKRGSDKINKPTEKQIDFAEKISEELNIDLPENKTFEEYGDYINEWKDEYFFSKNC